MSQFSLTQCQSLWAFFGELRRRVYTRAIHTRRQNDAFIALTTLHTYSSQFPILLPYSILRSIFPRDHGKRNSSVLATPGCVCAVLGAWQTWPTDLLHQRSPQSVQLLVTDCLALYNRFLGLRLENFTLPSPHCPPFN